ncbi:hypothetical protein DFH06DRAFT_1117942 [Mycena polygramma]|nr:hypothetical protein DFH06DRAFT_1117942 [Mycena polygramma]
MRWPFILVPFRVAGRRVLSLPRLVFTSRLEDDLPCHRLEALLSTHPFFSHDVPDVCGGRRIRVSDGAGAGDSRKQSATERGNNGKRVEACRNISWGRLLQDGITAVCAIDDSRQISKQRQTFDPADSRPQISLSSHPFNFILRALEAPLGALPSRTNFVCQNTDNSHPKIRMADVELKHRGAGSRSFLDQFQCSWTILGGIAEALSELQSESMELEPIQGFVDIGYWNTRSDFFCRAISCVWYRWIALPCAFPTHL